MSDKQQITLKVLAERLALSTSTVSRALRGDKSIKQITRDRVKQLAHKLKYRPNQIARNLQSNSSKVIGVVIPEIVHYFFANVIAGMEEIANKNGYTLMFCQSHELFEKEKNGINSFIAQRVDGLLVSIAAEADDSTFYKEIIDSGTPLVFYDRVPSHLNASKVIINDYEVSKIATQHLITNGCKSLLHVSSAPKLQISVDRKNGFIDAIKESDDEVKFEVLHIEGIQANNALNILETKVKQGLSFDGAFCINDMFAYCLLNALHNNNYKIPEDVSIVGFGNWQFSELIRPRITSIAQPGREIGKQSMRLLIDEIKSGESINETLIIPAKLMLRDSSSKNIT